MRRILASAITIAAIGVMPGLAGAADEDEPSLSVNYILELAPGEDPAIHVDWLLDKLGVPENKREERIVPVLDENKYFQYAINGAWLRLTEPEASKADLLTQPGIINGQISFDVAVPDNPLGEAFQPDGLSGKPMSGGQVVPTGYDRVGAEPGDYSNVDIAVLDTGVDSFHDDLNVVGGFDATLEGRTGQRPADSYLRDSYGHGTHVAGTIAALDNDRGTIGIAPGARIYSVPVLGDDGSGSMASLLAGVEYVASLGEQIDVVNMSLGGNNPATQRFGSDSLHNGIANVIENNGVTFVVSAGNSSTDAITSSPANYPEVVTVSALADFDGRPGALGQNPEGIPPEYVDDALAKFSNYGSVVDVTAPGVQIESTTPLNTLGVAHGTSMAAPHVTGVIGAWISENPRDRRHAAEAVLAWSADQWGVDSDWTGDLGPDHEPVVAFGAPAWEEMAE